MMDEVRDAEIARKWFEALLRDEACDLKVIHALIQQHSMEWLVGVFRGQHPNAMARSVPSLLAGACLQEDMQNELNSETLRGVRRAISEYLC